MSCFQRLSRVKIQSYHLCDKQASVDSVNPRYIAWYVLNSIPTDAVEGRIEIQQNPGIEALNIGFHSGYVLYIYIVIPVSIDSKQKIYQSVGIYTILHHSQS